MTKHDITIKDLIKICQGKLLCGDENMICEGFSKDTREIETDDIYVGIKGERFNGSTFYKQAFEKGAKACILQDIEIDEETLASGKTIVIVKDSVKALQELAKYKRSLYEIPIIAVTGSAGKTSTKDIIASVMGKKFNVLKTQGNLNNEIGLPLTILKLKEHTALVVEMGMNSFGEISVLTNIAKPDVAVFTNIGTAHIGLLGSKENILKAKLEILEGLNAKGTIIINQDDELLRNWANENQEKYSIITYGIENESDIMATNVKLEEMQSSYQVKIGNEIQEIKVPIAGEHFIRNSLCGVAIGKLFDISGEEIKLGISEFKLTRNRMQIEKNEKDIIIINDSYNASYEAMKASIEYLGKLEGRRKIAVLGNMLELGEYAKKLHEDIGKCIVENNIDLLYTVGNLASYIAQKATQLGMKQGNIFIYEEKRDLIQDLKEILTKGDAVLLKASNSMKFIEIYEEIK